MSLTQSIAKSEMRFDVAYLGIKAAVGTIFVAYGLQKFDPVWRELLIGFGLPPELQIPIALAETIGGIALIIGVLTRVTGAIFGIILVDAIFHIRWEKGFFIAQGGWDYDLALLAMVALIMVVGAGRISISSHMKRLPSLLR
ncbi:DoxX family protein [Candidatus Nitrosotenuis cloacae]|uniref:DoxX family protein n=1 Tax=Candidatus Nitrosotenuis cloacae TaxID=1603555 RepID=UPI002280A3D2|nr:DoxX family protein [Candidatus Nitrosotenuis cloacae]